MAEKKYIIDNAELMAEWNWESMSEYYGNYPCHRVVNHAGRLAPCFYEQGDRFREEGIKFLPNGCVDMKRHQWNP